MLPHNAENLVISFNELVEIMKQYKNGDIITMSVDEIAPYLEDMASNLPVTDIAPEAVA